MTQPPRFLLSPAEKDALIERQAKLIDAQEAQIAALLARIEALEKEHREALAAETEQRKALDKEIEGLRAELSAAREIEEVHQSLKNDAERLRLGNENLQSRLSQALRVMEEGIRELQGDSVVFEMDD